MKIFCKAIQAVTVEFFGVILVVGLLFGLPALGIQGVRGAAPPPAQTVAIRNRIPLAVVDPRGEKLARKSGRNSLWSFSLVNRDR